MSGELGFRSIEPVPPETRAVIEAETAQAAEGHTWDAPPHLLPAGSASAPLEGE